MKASIKKALFLLKLTGAFDLLMRHAYWHGFCAGHKHGKLFGNVIESDIESHYAEYEKMLKEDMGEE